ncbi:replication endonuclease [Pseudomonas sp. OV546]|uniref:replication endonuclease n=1 Tax=Pseudomonas sp. OV546 TaxID=1881063 RepID=UPI0008EFFB7B|nr:replication endonuclease [Pseudomonas sp. OV546]SFU66747.1 Bacteriophage replication gene A protein (GPA) [Pseudomonas sp. OV546]
MLSNQPKPSAVTDSVITLFDPRNKKMLRRLTADQVSGLTKHFISEIQAKIKNIQQNCLPEYRRLFSGDFNPQLPLDFEKKLRLIECGTHSCKAVDEILKKEAARYDQELRILCDIELSIYPYLRAPVRKCDHIIQISYLTDFSFVKRRFTKCVHNARLEYEAKTRSIGGKTDIDYCSNETVTFIRRRDEKNAEFLKRRDVLVKETGHLINLYDLHLKQAERKFNESYFIIKNLEAIAIERGLMPYMLTLTAPANYHPNPMNGRSSFDQTSSYDSQKYLTRTWAKLRALLNKRGTPFSLEKCFGVRTAELHKDGCVHWHILMFIDPNILEGFQQCLDFYFTSRQADVKEIDGVAAATYVLKYIGKTVDTSKLERTDLYDEQADKIRKEQDLSTIVDVERVRAGIRAMGIRQMQYYGIEGSLTLFRALNKITDPLANLPESVRAILSECRMHDRSNGNTKITNFLAFKNFLCDHLANVELIREEILNKHGATTKRVIGVRFLDSMIEILTGDKYEVVTNIQETTKPAETRALLHWQEDEKSKSKDKVTVISIYPRKADRTNLKSFARPTASELLKRAKLLNPDRYTTPYLACNAPPERSNPLTYAKICNLMSMP